MKTRIGHAKSLGAALAVLSSMALATPSIGPPPLPKFDSRLLGFEATLDPADLRLDEWITIPPGTVHIDLDVKHGGHRSVRLERDSSSRNDFSFIGQSTPLDFAGTTIELRGWLRREGEGVPSLWMRQDGGGADSVPFVDMSSSPAVTAEWRQFSISFPRKSTARSLFVGVRLVGTGKAWADDLELFVDGVPIAQVPRIDTRTIVEKDVEFTYGSKIALESLSSRQLDTLALTAKVWGFLKYHHPAVTGGTQHWDFALFRRLPKLLQSGTPHETQRLLVEWIDSLGPVPPCTRCLSVDSGWRVKPRLRWLEDVGLLGAGLSERLRSIHASRSADPQFYVKLAPNVGNPVFENELPYINVQFPDAGFQLLAVFRLWNMVEYWAPYRDLIDEDWDAVLRDSLGRFARRHDRSSYWNEVAQLVARLDDGHAHIGKVPVAGAPPLCPLPFNLRFVEDKFIVGSIPRPIAEDLRIGDVIVSIDGRPIAELVNEQRPFQGASNESARMRRIASALTWRPCGKGKLTIDRNGSQRIALERVKEGWQTLPRPTHDRSGETLQWLSPKIAYLKLSSIKQAEIEKQVTQIAAKADALIVDIRNYPSEFVVFALGSRLVDRSTPFATFLLPKWGSPGAFDFGSPVRLGGDTPQFAGRVAILVDESSQSQAEYTAMALRASPRAIVVGSQTAGADGNFSPILLPGHVPFGLSGIGVFYPDRTPTQQVGVKIDVPCKPTIAGIRAGRDEVLECALRALE
jgi:hypothetical protein